MGLDVLRDGRIAPRELALLFSQLCRQRRPDDVVALQGRLEETDAGLADYHAKVSAESNFLPVQCSECGASFRAHGWQLSDSILCPICDAEVITSYSLLRLGHLSVGTERAAERQAEYGGTAALGQFAHFRLLSVLGAGGCGKVYEAVNSHTGGRVALKVLKFVPLESRRSSLRRVLREANFASSMSHPHIVKVQEVGLAEGVPFVEMELVDGVSLKEQVESEGKLEWGHSCRMLSGTLSALELAHKHNVIHRDLKPGNILVDAAGRARVTDFGMSRFLDEATPESPGKLLGTPHFMAPEQWTNSPVGPWTDVYAMGLVLYFVLTGSLPFTGENALSVMYKHLHVCLPDVTDLSPEIPAFLADILQKAAAKGPDDRFSSAEEFRDALEPLL